MKTLRGMCIGAGYFSQFHFDAWQRIPEVEIVAICDSDEAKASRAVESFAAAEACNDAVAAIERLELDFVDIITPPPSHLGLVEAAARRSVAVICQKPLAPNFSTAREIVTTAERHAARLMVHENFRFQPWHREIKRLIDAGAIGAKLHNIYFRCRPGDGWGDDAYLARQPYFRHMPRFLVHETGVHFIDTFRFLAGEMSGEIVDAHAVLRRLNPAIRGEDAALLTFRFAGGATGVWDANRCNESNADDPRYTFGEMLVEGSGGSVRLHDDGRITVQPLGEPEREHEYSHVRRGFGGDCVYFTQRHFVDRLLDGQPFETSGRDYLNTLAVQEACYRSASLNRPIAVAAEQPTRRFVDISLTIDDNLRGATIAPAKSRAVDGWNATTLSLYSHCGTHMDAPRHFLDDGATIDQQSLDACCGPAWVIDLTPVEPRELIGVQRLAAWTDRIQAGDRLLLRTDWHRRVGSKEYRDALPRISPELAQWLVERGVALLGVEPPSVADVNDLDELTEVHQTLFRGGIVIVEGLANLDQLSGDLVEFIALPLRVAGGDGTPVRAIAVETIRINS